jgi:3-dehydroquinate synthase class II
MEQGDKVLIVNQHGFVQEAQVLENLGAGRLKIVTRNVHTVHSLNEGYQTNVFIVEALPTYHFVKAL